MGVPSNHPSLDHFSIETHGDLKITHFNKHPILGQLILTRTQGDHIIPVPRTRRDAKEGWVTLKGNSGQDLGRFEEAGSIFGRFGVSKRIVSEGASNNNQRRYYVYL